MSNVLARSFPPPRNWQDFERLCYDVYSRIWRTNDAQMHGRAGQPQFGVDVYGTDRLENLFAGVQCKGKDQGYGAELTAAELRDEVEKAKGFRPALQVFVLATTAPNDQAIQQLARDLTDEHKKTGLFEVRVEGWTTLSQRVSDYPELIRKYFSDLAPVDVTERIGDAIVVTKDEGEQTRAIVERSHAAIVAAVERIDPADPLQGRIGAFAKLVEDGSPVAGLKALERLWTDESPTASPRNRYRMRANIGFAHLVLGDTAKAMAELRAAAAEDPAWPPAQAILATAELLEGKREDAYAIAKEVLSADSSVQQASLVMLDAAPDSMALTTLEAEIPPAHRERIDVLIALAQRARRLGDTFARDRLLADAMQRDAHDWRVLATEGEILLEPVFALDGVSVTHVVPAAQVGNLNGAIEKLQQAWEILNKRDNAMIGSHVAANLLSALDIAGRNREYEQLLSEALNAAPEFPPLLRRYARSMMEVNDWASAAKALDTIPDEDAELSDRLGKIQARIHVGQAREGLEQARALEVEFPGERTGEIAAALQIEAGFAANCVEEVLDDVLPRWPTSIMLRSIAHNNFAEDDPRRAGFLAEIEELAKKLNNPSDRLSAADALYVAQQYGAAADMYPSLYSPDKDTLTLLRAMKALFFAERRREARELFESLSDDLKAMDRYADLGVAIYEHSGMLREARALLETNIARNDTLARRLHWLNLSERLNDRDAIATWLRSVPADLVCMPQELMQVALAIDRHLQDPKCFALAYRALRAAYSDPDLHAAYAIGLVFMGQTRKDRDAIVHPAAVAPDTAVILTEKDGPRRLVRVLGTASDPKIERGEIAPGTELWPELIGRKVGDEIEVPSIGIGPNIFVIREIRDKYLHAHFRSLEEFETMFPGHHALGSFHIDENKGDDKFKPLFDSIKRRGEFAKQLTDLYRNGETPLILLARFSGVSPCDAWEWVVGHPELGLRTCAGVGQEFLAARDVLAKNRKAVIDPITLYGLTRLGIAQDIRVCLDDLGVVQTTIDMLRRLVEERKLEIGKKRGTLSWNGENYVMVELDDAFAQWQVADAQAALTFAESLTLLPAEGGAGVPQAVRDIFEESDPAFLDTLYAAQGANRILHCDDHLLRILAREATGADGVWTQPIAMNSAVQGRMPARTYYDIVSALVGADYRLTAIDYHAVLHQLDKDSWATTARIRAFALQLALSTNEPLSLTRLLADIAQFGWGTAPNGAVYTAFFRVLFQAFRQTQPTRDLTQLVADIVAILRTRFRDNGLRIVLPRRLRRTTFNTSAELMIQSVFEAADTAAQQIGAALSAALW
jgi:tetratricopeptide (TPR) repeat protein